MMRFSASRMKTWMNCPLAAHYRYDDGLPSRQNAKASFGTIIHKALQHYNDTGNYEAAVAMFKDLWANPEKAGVQPDYWPKFTSYASLRTRGIDILRRFHDGQRFQQRVVIGTEIPFLVPFGRHELTGFVDLLETKKSGTGTELLRIVDYKSSSREPSRAALALDMQFTVYMYAVGQQEFWTGTGNPEYPGLPNGEWLWATIAPMQKRAIWWHLWNLKEIDAGPRNETDFQRMYRVCDEIERATQAQVWVPMVGESCTWCDYAEPCALEIPVAINQLEDRSDPARWI